MGGTALSAGHPQVTPVPLYQLTVVTLEHTCGARWTHVIRDDADAAFKYGHMRAAFAPCLAADGP